MELSELILLIHYEVQKTYDYIDGMSKAEQGNNNPVLHMSMDNFELEIPVVFAEKKLSFRNKTMNKKPEIYKLFKTPFSAEHFNKTGRIGINKTYGKILDAKVAGPQDKADSDNSTGKIARIKLTIKPIIK